MAGKARGGGVGARLGTHFGEQHDGVDTNGVRNKTQHTQKQTQQRHWKHERVPREGTGVGGKIKKQKEP